MRTYKIKRVFYFWKISIIKYANAISRECYVIKYVGISSIKLLHYSYARAAIKTTLQLYNNKSN